MHRFVRLTKFINKPNISVPELNYVCCRHLYSNAYLRIDDFIASQQNTRAQFGSLKENFFKRMSQNIENTSDNQLRGMIFSEDLKNVTFLAQNDEQFELLLNMIKRYTAQSQGVRFSSFVFGPVVLRLCHTLNKPDAALSLMLNEEYGEFFQQTTTYILAASTLYKNGKYEEILQLYDHFTTKSPMKNQFPRVLICYTLAACYKLNTEETYKVALNILHKSREHDDNLFRRSIAFISAFALKRGDPVLALEVLSMMNEYNFVTIRHLRVSALCDVGRVDDALMALRMRLKEDTPNLRKLKQGDSLVLNETILKVKENIDKLNNPEKTAEYKKVVQSLQENNLIEMKSFEETLFADEDRAAPQFKVVGQRDVRGSRPQFDRSQRKPVQNARKGLLDS